MTPTVWNIVLMLNAAYLGYNALKLLALWQSKRKEKAAPVKKKPWAALPSGWSQSYGEMTGYAMPQGGTYYWWVMRREKTIIEGPARTLELAQEEVERAVYELRGEMR